MDQKPVAYRRKNASERQSELIDAGIRCLGRGGMAAFTIDQICSQARVSRGLINHHFKSKEDLLVRIYRHMTDHLIDAAAAQDAGSQLRHVIEISFDDKSFNRSNLRAWLSVWGQVPTNKQLAKLHRERYRAYKQRIGRALTELRDAAGESWDCDRIARQLIALIDGLWLEYCLNTEGQSLTQARQDCYGFLKAHGIKI